MALDPNLINQRVESFLHLLMNKPGHYIKIKSYSQKHRCRAVVIQRIPDALKLMSICHDVRGNSIKVLKNDRSSSHDH